MPLSRVQFVAAAFVEFSQLLDSPSPLPQPTFFLTTLPYRLSANLRQPDAIWEPGCAVRHTEEGDLPN